MEESDGLCYSKVIRFFAQKPFAKTGNAADVTRHAHVTRVLPCSLVSLNVLLRTPLSAVLSPGMQPMHSKRKFTPEEKQQLLANLDIEGALASSLPAHAL